jgi:hypothetical protein
MGSTAKAKVLRKQGTGGMDRAGQIYESKWGAGFRNIIRAHQRTNHGKACSRQVRIEAIEEQTIGGGRGIIFSGDQRRTPE